MLDPLILVEVGLGGSSESKKSQKVTKERIKHTHTPLFSIPLVANGYTLTVHNLLSAKVHIQCNNSAGEIHSLVNAASRQPSDNRGGCQVGGPGHGGSRHGCFVVAVDVAAASPPAKSATSTAMMHFTTDIASTTCFNLKRPMSSLAMPPSHPPTPSTPTGTSKAVPTITSPVILIA
jgi:hypothetical protein